MIKNKGLFLRIAVPVVAVALSGCGGSSSPSSPQTPTPATPTPQPTPDPYAATDCTPTPPVLYGFRLKVHNDQGWKKVLDSRPIVRDAAYCAAIGEGGDTCVVRAEGDPQFIGCNNVAVGKSAATGRYGPDWYFNGEPCRGIFAGGDAAGCKNHETNQFLVYTFGPGEYMACGQGGIGCKTFTVQ